jgi:hypothetical protein
MVPAELGNVDKSIHATKVHEGSEVDHRRNVTTTTLTGLEIGKEVASLLFLTLFEPGTTGEDNVVAITVELDDSSLNGLADVGLQVTNATLLDERCGQEASETNVYDQTTLDDLNNQTGNDLIAVLEVFDVSPSLLVLSTLLGEDQSALLVFLLKDKSFDFFTDCDNLGGIDIVTDRELARRDNTFGLKANVKKYLITVNFDHDALYKVPIFEFQDGVAYDSG